MEDKDGDNGVAQPDQGPPHTPSTSGSFESSGRNAAPWALEPLPQATPSDPAGLYGSVCLELEQAMEQHHAASSNGGSNDGKTVGRARLVAQLLACAPRITRGFGNRLARRPRRVAVLRPGAAHHIGARGRGALQPLRPSAQRHGVQGLPPRPGLQGECASLCDHTRAPARPAAPVPPWPERRRLHASPGPPRAATRRRKRSRRPRGELAAAPALPFLAQGCGLVKMSTPQEATAAIEGLDDRFQWAGMTGPMVVELMDSSLQRQRRWAGLVAIGCRWRRRRWSPCLQRRRRLGGGA
jgi:hypothetical protein